MPAATGPCCCWAAGLSAARSFSRLPVRSSSHTSGRFSGDGDPGGDRLGEEDGWFVFRRRQALDGPNCLVHLPDWPAGPAGHFCGYADRPTDAVLMVGLDRGGRGGVDFPGTAVELVARPGPADGGAGGSDRLRSTRRSPAVCLPPSCPGAFRPRSGRLFQSQAGIAGADVDGPGANRLGRFLSRSRLAQPGATRPDGEPGHRRRPALACLGHDEWIVIPERHLHTALHDYDLSPLPFEQAGRFRLYRRSDVEPRALVSRADCPLLR